MILSYIVLIVIVLIVLAMQIQAHLKYKIHQSRNTLIWWMPLSEESDFINEALKLTQSGHFKAGL